MGCAFKINLKLYVIWLVDNSLKIFSTTTFQFPLFSKMFCMNKTVKGRKEKGFYLLTMRHGSTPSSEVSLLLEDWYADLWRSRKAHLRPCAWAMCRPRRILSSCWTDFHQQVSHSNSPISPWNQSLKVSPNSMYNKWSCQPSCLLVTTLWNQTGQ